MRLAVWGLCGLLAASAPAIAQERFDLRDFNRKPIPNSTTAFFECTNPNACGNGSAVSGRMGAIPNPPPTVDSQKALQVRIAQRMREQSEGRLKDVELGETKEIQVESLRLIFSEKRLINKDGSARTMVDGVMVGKTRMYSIVSSGTKPEQVRNNFNGFVRVIALVLDQVALDAPAPASGGASGPGSSSRPQ